ncbi:MAG: molybdate ABC transporter substrate-binding protein, partial [Turicibacter sp.]
DLAKPNLQVVLANESVPIGQYAASIIDSIDENEPGFKAGVDHNIVSREENVRQVLMKITLNEGDAAFVYQTDLTPDVNDQVTVVYLPNEYDVISEYYMGIIKQNEVKKEAEQLYDYILSDAGQEVLKSYGYE